jgi:carboxypeptidase Taq
MAVIHEAGHGTHAQGLSPALYRSTLESTGLATAESQSRFYENMIGRSRAFWTFWYPKLQETFPGLKDTPLEAFYRALNVVRPGLIRVEADEVTYGLHIVLRFELENDLINGRVKVNDLPSAWNDRMEALLGVRPLTDSDGVLQDIHWAHGGMGYFPDYWLGSIFAAQLWDKLQVDQPGVSAEIASGRYASTLAWLRENIHQHGNKFTFPELVERVTGGPLRWEPYVKYLNAKFGEIYGL